MGQAKQRGTLEQRRAQAQSRIEALKPEKLLCNECDGETTDIQVLDSRGIPGVEAVFGGQCPKCHGNILAVRGTPEAAEAVMSAFLSANGTGGSLGMQDTKGEFHKAEADINPHRD